MYLNGKLAATEIKEGNVPSTKTTIAKGLKIELKGILIIGQVTIHFIPARMSINYDSPAH